MLKLGIPVEAVKGKMAMAGVDLSVLDHPTATVSCNAEVIENSDQLKKGKNLLTTVDASMVNDRSVIDFTTDQKDEVTQFPQFVSSTLSTKPEGWLRFVCISDTHNRSMKISIPDGDVLIHAGDFTNSGTVSNTRDFNDFLLALPHRHKVVIAGNHDITFEPSYYEKNWRRFHSKKQSCVDARAQLTNCTYLEDEAVIIEGIKIYGSPWQPEFCEWAFNLDRGVPLREKWDLIPDDTDILVTHGPPRGHGGLCSSGIDAGCEELLGALEGRIQPKYHVFGHVHEGYGVTTNGNSVFINASTCSFNYQAINPAIVFDVPPADSEEFKNWTVAEVGVPNMCRDVALPV
jgi:Icc-related predicted phosphoesterase